VTTALSSALDPVGGEPLTAIHHSGELTWRDFPALAERVKRHLASQGLASAHRHRVFSTFVEMTYNVLNHGLAAEPRPGDPGRRVQAELALGSQDGLVWIASENRVRAGEAPALEHRVRALRAMGPETLRATYRQQVVQGGERGALGTGGGLGLLTIARDAARPVEFALVPAAATDAFLFRLKVVV
jgi:hypothetical protein